MHLILFELISKACVTNNKISLTLLQGQSIQLQRQRMMRLLPLLPTLLQPVKQALQLPIHVRRCVAWHHQLFQLFRYIATANNNIKSISHYIINLIRLT